MRKLSLLIGSIGVITLSGLSTAGCASDDDDSGANAGAGGTAGMGAGGMGGTPCVGDPPVTEHNHCADIASQKKGDASFTITSPDFTECGEIPKATTCDGKAFGTGASPKLEISGVPSGTKSLALVFKDIAILADGDPTKDKFGYHWVMWDIPPTTTTLPAGMGGGYHSTDVSGALQWAQRNQYAYFPPCPNPFPRDDVRFMCSLVIDSYAFTLYAFDKEKLEELPPPDMDPATGMPTGNWVVNMGHYIEGLTALAVTEYRGTSQAWSTSFAPPDPFEYPCTQAMIDGSMTSTCLQ
jgi:phosphatidylethanolamine-binding protein (PEBP) family uncharacterized protein